MGLLCPPPRPLVGPFVVYRNEFFYIPDFWEYSFHEWPHVKQTEWPDLLKPQVQVQAEAAVGP